MKRKTEPPEEDAYDIMLDEFDWLIYNRYYAIPPGASLYVRGSGGWVTCEDLTLPEKGTREYKRFRRWQRGSLLRRLVDFVSRSRQE